MIIAIGFKVDNNKAAANKEHMGLTNWLVCPL